MERVNKTPKSTSSTGYSSSKKPIVEKIIFDNNVEKIYTYICKTNLPSNYKSNHNNCKRYLVKGTSKIYRSYEQITR